MIHCGDAFEWLGSLPEGSASLVVLDPPYGSTQLEWDNWPEGSWGRLWPLVWRGLKPSGVAVCFGTVRSLTPVFALKEFYYHLVWEKQLAVGFLDSGFRPLRCHEVIAVLSRAKKASRYAPRQRFAEESDFGTPDTLRRTIKRRILSAHYGDAVATEYELGAGRKWRDVLRFPVLGKTNRRAKGYHPTEKPLALAEWIVETYCGPEERVIDPFCGSGVFGHAAVNLGRGYQGCDASSEWAKRATARIEAARMGRPALQAVQA